MAHWYANFRKPSDLDWVEEHPALLWPETTWETCANVKWMLDVARDNPHLSDALIEIVERYSRNAPRTLIKFDTAMAAIKGRTDPELLVEYGQQFELHRKHNLIWAVRGLIGRILGVDVFRMDDYFICLNAVFSDLPANSILSNMTIPSEEAAALCRVIRAHMSCPWL